MTKNRIEFQKIEELLVSDTPIQRIAVAGHVHPDGDCVGSCSALALYLRKYYPQCETDLFLEEPRAEIAGIPGASSAQSTLPENIKYDLFITCDASSIDRIGVAGELLGKTENTVCIDHHVSNPGFAGRHVICPDASSCAEVLAGLMDETRIDSEIAEALYTGIIHDSGVFQYRNTSPDTLRTAAMLLEKGVDAARIISETFNQRSYTQARILGYALEKSVLTADGKLIISSLTAQEMQRYGATLQDLDGIVAQLRFTAGTMAAAFLYENAPGIFKASLRSDGICIDVAEIAQQFGGGGHAAAAGFNLTGEVSEVTETVTAAVEKAINDPRNNGGL